MIVDDGLHTIQAQLDTATQLIPHVRAGGSYIIEDIQPGAQPGAQLLKAKIEEKRLKDKKGILNSKGHAVSHRANFMLVCDALVYFLLALTARTRRAAVCRRIYIF